MIAAEVSNERPGFEEDRRYPRHRQVLFRFHLLAEIGLQSLMYCDAQGQIAVLGLGQVQPVFEPPPGRTVEEGAHSGTSQCDRAESGSRRRAWKKTV